MALGPLPPWLDVTPSFFTSALEAGARTGLAVADQNQRAAALAESRAERQAAQQQRYDEQAQREQEFQQSHLLNVQKVAQDAAQLQQQIAHQTALEQNQQAQESRLFNYDTGRLAVENRRAATQEKQASTPPTLVTGVGLGQGYLLDSRGIPHPIPAPPVASMLPQDRVPTVIKDEAGNVIAHDVGGNRIIPVAKNEPEITALRARASLLEQQYMINNPPKGSAEEKRISDALLTIDKRLEELTTGKNVGTATKGVTGTINPWPKSKADLVVGELYEHPKFGIGRWTGKQFDAVEVR